MTTELTRLTTPERRRALRLGVVSGTLWSIGNGWTTGSLVTYLALELGAMGFEIGALLAWQTLVGVLRLAAPRIIRRLGGVKPAALVLLLIGYGLLAALPVLVWEGLSFATRLRLFVAILCIHQLFENLGSVAVSTWLAELVPRRLRGRYFAARQRWQLAALIPTSVAAAVLVDRWRAAAHLAASQPVSETSDPILGGYVLVLSAGALFLLLSLVPLWRMPAVATDQLARRGDGLWSAVRDPRFVRLLVCVCWLSLANGLSQSAANIYPKHVLKLTLLPMIVLPLLMRLGQMGLSPWVGRFSDRWGNRPTIFVCQALVAFGPLFYVLATPQHPQWIAGAFVVWSAFVGLNVCLPNLTFRLAPPGELAQYTAVYLTASGLAYGLSTLGAGWLFDFVRDQPAFKGHQGVDIFVGFFLASWVARLLGLIFVARLREPGARTFREILGRGRSVPA